MKTAVFTIASRNYFGVVKTLMDSLEKTNADYDRFVGVADEVNDEFASMAWNFNLLSLEDIEIPNKKNMLFRYTILELNTAIKPFVFKTLFLKYGYDRVIYIDPDIYVYHKLDKIDNAFEEGHEIVLTPHFTGNWPEDDKLPNEVSIMQAGVYNLGFLALSKSSNTINLLDWWGGKLEKLCVVAIEKGIFVDQKWMDLVPGLFEKVFILRDEGYNVAYWNLSHRKASKKNGEYYFNDQLLIFFHYSGLNSKSIHNVSKHQNRFTINDIGVAKELFEDYAKRVLDNNYEMYHKFIYAFDYFENGNIISDLFRVAYSNNAWLEDACGKNPFESEHIFYEKRAKLIPFMLEYVWNKRPDVQKAYPNLASQNYINWFISACEREYKLPTSYMTEYFSQITEKEVKEISKSLNKTSQFTKIAMFLKRHLPPTAYEACKKLYKSIKKKDINIVIPQELKKGVQLVGYIRSEHGVGEAMRHMAKAVNKTGLPWSIYDFEIGNLARQKDTTWDFKIVDTFEYKVLILNINADQIPVAKQNIPEEIWNSCYKIGVWFWELPEFPDEWVPAFEMLDEVWAPTHFIEDALREKATCPVYYMPLEMTLDLPETINRGKFGLPDNAFLFLNMYDTLSMVSRKNPEAAIRAFKKAFKPDDETVGLVIKINNSAMAQEKELLDRLREDYHNIYFITDILSRQDVNELLLCCDVAVSLHRSEGLGLLCQEAMYAGKPVIATNWSGNTDFMTEDNSCLIGYELRPIGQDIGPYKAHQKWAEVHEDAVIQYMIKLKDDTAYFEKIAEQARKSIQNNYSTELCAEKIVQRLSIICEKKTADEHYHKL